MPKMRFKIHLPLKVAKTIQHPVKLIFKRIQIMLTKKFFTYQNTYTGNWIFVLLQLLCYNRAGKVIAYKELDVILGAFFGAFLKKYPTKP